MVDLPVDRDVVAEVILVHQALADVHLDLLHACDGSRVDRSKRTTLLTTHSANILRAIGDLCGR